MEWTDKTKMIQLGKDQGNTKAFQEFVLEHINEFDSQAWDMFIEISDVNIKQMIEDKAYWKQIYPHLKKVNCEDSKFGFRTRFRIALSRAICEERLLLS